MIIPLFVLDANALLAPFGVGKVGQEEIARLYSALREHGRLYAPEHALREYLRNRSQKIADMHDRLNRDVSSLDGAIAPPACAMLEYSEEYQSLTKAAEELRSARKQYLRGLQNLCRVLADWQWDDPISRLYATIFDEDAVIKCCIKHEAATTLLTFRSC